MAPLLVCPSTNCCIENKDVSKHAEVPCLKTEIFRWLQDRIYLFFVRSEGIMYATLPGVVAEAES